MYLRNGICSITAAGFALLLLGIAPHTAAGQSNQEWDLLWKHTLDTSLHVPYTWMAARPGNFTGITYDRWRDVLYVVNPDLYNDIVPTPRIHAWKATTGEIDSSVGRGPAGRGGQLSVPVDTVSGGYMFGRYCIYKIDLDDEGRIYACNVVSPLWNPPFMCPSADMTTQGPFKVYRWDTPSSAPRLVYATLDSMHAALGTSVMNSEMAWTRWGDAFDVVGKRGYEPRGGGQGPLLVDSVRILASGGQFQCQTETNRQVNIFLADRRGNAPYEFRLAIKMVSSLEGIASHGVAATGPFCMAPIWMDNNNRVTTLNNQVETGAPWPQTASMTSQFSVSQDSATGTGFAGPVACFTAPGAARSYLVCADGRPGDLVDWTTPNYRTSARVLDVTNPSAAFVFRGVTPKLGLRWQDNLNESDGLNFIADVDFKLEPDSGGTGYYLVVFVLMSNNGIAAYRTKNAAIVPVELLTFDAEAGERDVTLRWATAREHNNAGFEVQRSFSGGRVWDVVAFIPARGGAIGAAYDFRDPLQETHRGVGTVLYRLRQVDLDGSSSLSPERTVFCGPATAAPAIVSVYPNPCSSTSTIAIRLPAAAAVRLRILNCLGEELRTVADGAMDAGTHIFDVSAAGLPAGTYIAELSADGILTRTALLVVK